MNTSGKHKKTFREKSHDEKQAVFHHFYQIRRIVVSLLQQEW